MRKFRWQLLIIFLAGLVVGILLLGEQPQAPSPEATPEPVKGGVYSEALIGSFQRLNPILTYNNQADHDVTSLLFKGLVTFDGNGIPRPDLADWGISADGTLYNVTLKEGLTWHDGKPVTADDVIFTIELMRNGGSIVPADLQALWKGVEVVRLSDLALQIQLPEAYAPFLDYLNFGILPKHLLDGKTIDQIADDPFNLQPIGNGPYRFSRFIVENDQVVGVVLSAYGDFSLTKPYLDELVFRYYPDAPAALKAYRDGLVQGIGNVTPDILNEVLAEPGLSLHTVRQPKLTLVLFNLDNPEVAFLQDKAIRRALLEAINRQGMIDRTLLGQAVQADGPILPGTWSFYEKTKKVEFNPEAARNALKQAGYALATEQDTYLSKDGVYLRFTLVHPDTSEHRAIAEAIQAGWESLGVEVNLEALPYDQLVGDRLNPRAYQAALVDLNLSNTPDPDPYPFWDQAQIGPEGQNYAQWSNRMASEYLESARVSTDIGERARFYRNFQVIFADELPALPLFYSVYNYAVSNTIQGVRVGPLFDPAQRLAGITGWFLAGQPPRVASPTVTVAP